MNQLASLQGIAYVTPPYYYIQLLHLQESVLLKKSFINVLKKLFKGI